MLFLTPKNVTIERPIVLFTHANSVMRVDESSFGARVAVKKDNDVGRHRRQKRWSRKNGVGSVTGDGDVRHQGHRIG